MSTLCFLGGAIGYARTRSIPSMVAGLAIGSLYALSGLRMREGLSYGYEGAAGEFWEWSRWWLGVVKRGNLLARRSSSQEEVRCWARCHIRCGYHCSLRSEVTDCPRYST